MEIYIILTVLQIVSLNRAFEFICPSQAHWRLRAKSMCKPPSNYTCLFDVNFQINVYRDKCSRPRILGPGYKYVFQPNLNRAACSANRYQPFIFETIGYSDCTYKKSFCSSQGQETFDNSNTRSDTTCICNTDRGYTFIMNSKKQCYCNPSTEDCSCFLGTNPYNTTVELEDIKCYQEIKLTKDPYLKDTFNISQKIRIIEFDNYKYNLKHFPTNEYRIEAAKWVFILSLVTCVVCIIIQINPLRLRQSTKTCSTIPEAINKLSQDDKTRYNKLMQTSKTEKRYFVRIMIVGKESVGKTCLMRRLLKEDISDVTSTDGVDIVVSRCKINIQDGTWIIGKEIVDDKVSRIKRALIPIAEDKVVQTDKTDKTTNIKMSQRNDISTNKIDTTTNTTVSQDKSEDKYESSSMVMPEVLTTVANISLEKNEDANETSTFVMPKAYPTQSKVKMENNGEQNETSSLVMPADLMSNVFSNSTGDTPVNLYALSELWDFAGQKEFYATHQAFLTSCAVYLVVADMKDDITKQGLSQCFADFKHIGEYIGFWFDSIHCHRTTDETAKNMHFDPPILLVFTGKDNYDQANFMKRKEELIKQIDEVLGFQSKYHHLHLTFYLSNKIDTEEDFEMVRYAIYETAKTMDIWGEDFPLKWILLEHLIETNKNDGKNFITLNDMSKLAKHPEINILKEEDLLLFLRFQHNVGNIIFFENIPNLIILKPQWLADAFRCLVSDRFDNSKLQHRKDWTLFTRQGKISESLITELFKSKDGSQFSGQKDNLQEVMEKLDILVRIKKTGYFIMPSKMPSSTFDVVCEKFGIRTEKCKRSSWLCFKFEFLPPSFFNHLSAWFLRKYDPSTVDNGIALYRGICVFDLDRSGGKKILFTMSTDTIALQVLTFSEQHEGFGSTCSDIYSEVTKLIEDIKVRYKVKISFKLHFNCNDASQFKDTFDYEKLTSEKELFCIQHTQMHRSEEIYSLWMNKEVLLIPDRAQTNTTQDDQNAVGKQHSKRVPPFCRRQRLQKTREMLFLENMEDESSKGEVAPDQTSVKTNPPVGVILRQRIYISKSNSEIRHIRSCIKIGNTLVFTESYKDRLIICNSDGTDINHIPLPYTPYSITVINSYTVAVSCSNKTILIINISTRSITKTINTSDDCSGISYNDDNLYVVIKDKIIHVMDLTGKVIRTVRVPTHFIYDITVDRDRLVCIDWTSIYCCSLDGQLIWKFKQHGHHMFHTVTTDDERNVYVSILKTETVGFASYYEENGYNFNTVVVVSNDGQHHRELLTESDELYAPWGIYCDKQENILLVSNEEDGNVFLFDVKKI